MKLFISVIVFFTSISAFGQFSGTYIIGSPSNFDPSDNFTSLSDAINSLKYDSLVGDVNFILRNGTHPGIQRIAGYEDNGYTLTIKSLSGKRDSVTATIDGLYRIENVLIQDITIKPKLNTSALYTNKGLEINGCVNIKFDNCIINGDKTDYYYKNGLWFTGTRDFSVTNCYFYNLENALILSGSGAYYGITSHNGNKLIANNEFVSITTGIYVDGDLRDSLVITNNYIDSPEYGIVFITVHIFPSSINVISKNRVINAHPNALSFVHFDSASRKILVENNMFAKNDNFPSNTLTGLINFKYAEDINFIHNSVYGKLTFERVRNIISNSNACYTDSSYLLNFNSYVTNYSASHNSYYSEDTINSPFIYGYTSFRDLDSLKIYTNSETNSIIAHPYFISKIDLHACSDKLMGAGKPVTNTNYDIDNELIDKAKPDIGCDEFKNSAIKPCAFYTLGCDTGSPYTFQFENSSPRLNTSFWDFDDGTVSNANVGKHTFPGQGIYHVKLVTANNFGSDSVTTTIDLTSVKPEFLTVKGDTLSVDSTYSNYQWFANGSEIPNANKPFFIKSFGAEFTVSFTNKINCQQFSNSHNNIGLVEESPNPAIIYPNPTNGTFQINFNSIATRQIKIYNAQGQLMQDIFSSEQQLKTTINSRSGMYHLEVLEGGKRIEILRIIKL